MSDSPIFSQLVREFAAKGAVYDDFIKWSTPAFEWAPRHVVQLDKQKKLGMKPQSLAGALGLGTETAIKGRLEAQQIEQRIQNYISEVGRDFAEQHPSAVVNGVSFETYDDGSVAIAIEATQPIDSVMPFPGRYTAQRME